MCSHDWLKGRILGAYFYFYIIFLVLIYMLSNFILFQTVEPRVVKIAYLLMNHLQQLQIRKIKLMVIKVGFHVSPYSDGTRLLYSILYTELLTFVKVSLTYFSISVQLPKYRIRPLCPRRSEILHFVVLCFHIPCLKYALPLSKLTIL